jgi:hypothetical protein
MASDGAYGFRIDGVAGAADLLVEAPATWPRLTIERASGGTRPRTEQVTRDHARVWLTGGGFATVDRAEASARLHVPEETSDGALVHPFLAPVVLVMSRWLGRETMHGGGVVLDGGVWAIVAHKTGGKSTVLATLALAGHGVASDDVLVIDDGTVLVGPRSIDLRDEAATRLEVGEPLGRVGARERWRLPLAPVPPELPLRGWISLEWGDEIGVEFLRGADRLAALIPHRGVRLAPTAPGALLQLSGLPHIRFTRPRRWDVLPDATARLVSAITG